jgi:hypothetical protein
MYPARRLAFQQMEREGGKISANSRWSEVKKWSEKEEKKNIEKFRKKKKRKPM